MSTKLEAEALIIGSGAGGATVFERLAAAGVDVLMVEEGDWISPDQLQQPINTRLQTLYRDAGIQPILGLPTVIYGEGRAVGGSTEVNGGLLWAPPYKVLDTWIAAGLFAGVARNDLDAAFARIERDLSVHPSELIAGSDKDSSLLAAGADQLGWSATRARRAVRNCLRANECGAGCPNGAKQSMSTTYIPRGVASGGRLIPGVSVKGIIADRRNNIMRVKAIREVDRQPVTLHARDVFLASGALHSPSLLSTLHRTPRRNRLGIHLNAKVIAEFSTPIHAQRGTIFTEQVQDFIDEGLLLMATNFQPEFLSLALSTVDKQSVKEMWSSMDSIGMYTVQTRPHSYASIATFQGRALPTFRLSPRDKEQLIIGVLRLSQALFTAGALAVRLPLTGLPRVESSADAETVLRSSAGRDWQLTTVHAMSSLPLGNHSHSPFGFNGQSVKNPHLWLCDASALPTTVGESPQGSIMLVADHIAKNFLASRNS